MCLCMCIFVSDSKCCQLPVVSRFPGVRLASRRARLTAEPQQQPSATQPSGSALLVFLAQWHAPGISRGAVLPLNTELSKALLPNIVTSSDIQFPAWKAQQFGTNYASLRLFSEVMQVACGAAQVSEWITHTQRNLSLFDFLCWLVSVIYYFMLHQ